MLILSTSSHHLLLLFKHMICFSFLCYFFLPRLGILMMEHENKFGCYCTTNVVCSFATLFFYRILESSIKQRDLDLIVLLLWPIVFTVSVVLYLTICVGQATYPAYGAYDYSHQMPQSAPQAAAYGAYPSTYPPQVPNLLSSNIRKILLEIKVIFSHTYSFF
jgi:hypothetical protein